MGQLTAAQRGFRPRVRDLRFGRGGNFKIICKDRQWLLEETLLRSQSAYFEQLCTGDNTEQVAATEADLSEFEPQVINHILLYITTGNYIDSRGTEQSSLNDEAVTTRVRKIKAVSDQGACNAHGSQSIKTEREPRWAIEKQHPGSHATATPAVDRVTRGFKTSIQVYALARTFGLHKLAPLVADRVMSREEDLQHSHLFDVIKMLLNDTQRDDVDLRLRVLDRCMVNYGVVRRYHPEAEQVILQHEPMMWKLGLARLQEAGVGKMVAKMTEIKLLVKAGDARQTVKKGQAATRDRVLRALFDEVHLLSFEKTTIQHELAQVKDTCQDLKNQVHSLTGDEDATDDDTTDDDTTDDDTTDDDTTDEDDDTHQEPLSTVMDVANVQPEFAASLQDYANAMDVHDVSRRSCNCGAAIISCKVECAPDIEGRISVRCYCDTEHVFSAQTDIRSGKTVQVTDWLQYRPS